MCSIICRRLLSVQPHHNLSLLRSISTSQPRRVIDALACISAGHVFQTMWPNIGFYYKCVAFALPVVTTGYLTTYCLFRYKYDHLLGRKKLALSPNFGFKPQLTKRPMLSGAPVLAVNGLLNELVEKNSLEYATNDPSYRWQLFVFEETKDWYNLNEAGQIFISKDILLRLSKRELMSFLSIQMAHVLSKHTTEINSYSVATSYYLSILLGTYAFFVPRLISFPADLSLLVLVHYITGYSLAQMKFRSLLTEADKLALKFAKNCDINENDFISLFGKLKQARTTLPWIHKCTTYCYYDHRIAKLQSYPKSGK